MTKNEKPKIDEIEAAYGRIPPQDIELEEGVIGALMVERDAIMKVEIVPEVFYKEEHREIFRTIEALNEKGQNIDLLTVTSELKNRGKLETVGGPAQITKLTRKIASAAHIEQHVRFLLQSYIRRELIRVSHQIISLAYDTSNELDEILQLYESAVSQIDRIIVGKKKGREIKAVLKSLTDELNNRCRLAAKGGLTGINTGFGQLNRITSGWQPNWLIILAARPAMGKTAIAINKFAKAAAKSGKWVNIFSLEMEDISLTERLVLGASGIETYVLRNGLMTESDWEKYNRALSELEKLTIFIDDSPYVKVSHIRNVARTNRRQNKCDLIIIDYLQLANAGGNANQNREQQVAEMSRQLKALAKELGIPIILLSQLSREVEKRGGNKKPNMSDLRESGAIEQDADLILFPWRPVYYGIQPEVDEPNNYGELVFAKNRHGYMEDIKFWHNGTMTDFSDLPFSQNRYSEQRNHQPVNYSEGISANSDFEDEIDFDRPNGNLPF